MADSSVNIRFVGHAGSAVGAVRQIEGAFGGLASRAKALIGILGVAGIGAALVKAGRAAIDFDRGMRNVNSIAQLSEKQLQALSKRVLALAGPTAQAPKTLAAGLYDIVSSGFKADDAIKILAVSAKAATAGLTDTATSTKAVVAVLNAYKRGAGDAREVSDVLFQTVNKGVLTFEELSTSIGDVLPFAAQLAVPLEEVGAAMATMTLQGLSAAESSTRLKGILVQLLKPNDDLAGAITDLGFASGEALVKQEGLVGAVRLLDGAAKGNKQTIAAWMSDIRAIGGFLSLSGQQLDVFTGNVRAMDQASQGAGATARAFGEQSKSLAFQWDRAKASLAAAAIPIATLLFPALTRGAQAVADFAGRVTESMPRIRAEFDRLKGVAGVIGDVAKALFNFARTDIGLGILAAVGSMRALMGAATLAKGAVAALLGLGLGGWAGAAVVGAGLLVGALTTLALKGDTASQAIRGIKAALDALAGASQSAAEAEDAHVGSMQRLRQAELGVEVALQNVRRTREAVTAGDLKGRDADLAVLQALQQKRDAYNELKRAIREEEKAHQALAAAREREGQAADESKRKVEEVADAYNEAAKAMREQQQRLEAGDIFAMTDARRAKAEIQGVADEARKAEEFIRVMGSAMKEAAKAASDPKMTTEGRKAAAVIRDQAAAAVLLAEQLGRIPTEKEVKALLDNKQAMRAIRDMLREQGLIKDKKTKVTADTARATSDLNALRGLLSSLRDRTVTITFRGVRVGTFPGLSGGSGVSRASGGFIPGPETGGRDAVPAMLAPGEVVLNRGQQQALGGPGAIARMFGFSTAGVPGVQSFATGGFVAGFTRRLRRSAQRDRANNGYKSKLKAVEGLQRRLDRNREDQDRLSRSIDQDDREFSISVEEFIKVDADGNESLDTAAVQQRVSEIDKLIQRRNALLGLIDEETGILNSLLAALAAAVQAYQAEIKDQQRVIREMTDLIRDATEKMRTAPESAQAGYQAIIDKAERRRDGARSKIDELRGLIETARDDRAGVNRDKRDQPLDSRDVSLAIQELGAEKAEVLAIKPRPKEPTSSDTGFGDSGGGSPGETISGPDLQAVIDRLREELEALRLALQLDIVQGGIIGSFAKGTIHVPETGLAMVHAGETIVPAGVTRARGGDGGSVGDLVVQISIADGMEWLARYIDARVVKGHGRVSIEMGREADRRLRAGIY